MRMSSSLRIAFTLMLVALFGAVSVGVADAQYFKRPESNIDPKIMLFDEKTVLGNRISNDTVLIDENGKEFVWKDMLGKPIILVLAYYSCDGSCSIINNSLHNLLKKVSRIVPGDDYRVVTLSFDRHDDLKTTDAFKKTLKLSPELAKHWTFATFKSEEALKKQTEKIGFKFFWVPEDRVFLHPGAFLFFSPKGRLVRVLYQDAVSSDDVDLAVLDARQGQFRPSEVINFAISLCYSYNYADGKYRLSIPIFVGMGALLFGLLLFASSAIYFTLSKKNTQNRGRDNAEAI